MNRRDFLNRVGLGTAGLFLVPGVLATGIDAQWTTQEAVRFAMEQALKNGAKYADARIGKCELACESEGETSVVLGQGEWMGIRFCTETGWRHLLLRDFSQSDIAEHLRHAMQAQAQPMKEDRYWIVAAFDAEEVKAGISSDAETAETLQSAHLRYALRQPRPASTVQRVFCDILLEQ